jgi:hypothetical protein
MSQGRNKWRVLVNSEMKLRVMYLVSFSKRTVLPCAEVLPLEVSPSNVVLVLRASVLGCRWRLRISSVLVSVGVYITVISICEV